MMGKVTVTFNVDDRDEADLMERLEAELVQGDHPWIPGAHLQKVRSVELVGDDRACGRTFVARNGMRGMWDRRRT
jgi:hypothetical protein